MPGHLYTPPAAGRVIFWIIGNNLDDLKKDTHGRVHEVAVVIEAKGHTWKLHKCGTPIATSGGNQKLWVRMKHVSAPPLAPPGTLKPKTVDDDFAATTITITNADDEPSDPPTASPGAAVIDGPDPAP